QVLLSTYIFDATGVGERFVRALAEAAARGVEVRVLVDGVGAWYSWPRAVTRLRQAGVVAECFNPPRLWSWVACLNLRNHRKILVVDGRLAFTGGINIRNQHLPANGAPARAEDLHFVLDGPVAQALAQLFVDDWRFVSAQPVGDPVPAAAGQGRSLCRVIEDGPDENLDRLLRLILAAVHQSRERIRVITPYFLPPREIMLALQNAALRGVDVQVLLPEQNNLPFVYWASRHILTPLLDTGVRVFLYRNTFLHAKLLAVDGGYVQMGSYNLDQRSLRLNFELGVEIHDPAVCREAEAYFAEKRAAARELTAAELAGRRWPARLRDAVCWLFSPYL